MKYFVLVLLILTGSDCHPLQGESQKSNPDGLTSLERGSQLSEDLTNSHWRGRHFVNSGDEGNDKKLNESNQACTAPGNAKGHCRHLSNCVLEEFRANSSRFMDYLCIIEQTYVGTCCPDGAEIIRTNSLDAETTAGFLPAVASANEDIPILGMDRESEADDLETAGSKTSVTMSTLRNRNVTKDSVVKKITGEPRGPRGCGMSTKSRMRIVGGRPADPQEWPWMAALLRDDATHYCGGVLVTDRHVLTAAHCVYQYKAREIRVRLGEYDFRKPDESRSLDFRVAEIRQHLDFDPATYEHDIAIVKIHRPTKFNNYVWPICLPPVGLTFENKSAIVTGWGTKFFGGPASPVLMEVAIPIWPQRKCSRSFNQRIPETVMCAAGYEGGRDSCQGDSGGPLLHQLGNGRWVNVGIVSWGIRCGEPGHPGIYTRVNSYLDWIFANAIF